MVITGGLVLVYNVYGLERDRGRSALRWNAAALAAVWLCDLNFYVIAWLGDSQPQAMTVLRAVVLVPVAAMLAIARTRSAQRRPATATPT